MAKIPMHRPEGVFSLRKLFVALVVLFVLAGGVWFVFRGRSVSAPDPMPEFMRATEGLSVIELSGIVLSVDGDAIMLDVPQVLGVPVPEEADIRTRTVFAAFDTTIVERREKTRDELNRERRAAGNPLTVLPYVTKDLVMSDIQPGDLIRVSVGGRDIKYEAEIAATDIARLLPRTPL